MATVVQPPQVGVPRAPIPVAEPTTKACPFCAETVLAAAIKCKHCGEMLNAPPRVDPHTLLFTAHGITGQIDLFGDRLRIRRKGFMAFMAQGSKGDKDILLGSVTGIQLKKPGWTNGYFQIVFSGSKESKSGTWDAVHDENTVMFNAKQQEQFEFLRAKVYELRSM